MKMCTLYDLRIGTYGGTVFFEEILMFSVCHPMLLSVRLLHDVFSLSVVVESFFGFI